MAGYTPLFDSLTTGTLCGKWPDIGLWPIILSLCDRGGLVDVTPAYLSGITGLPVAEITACMERFCAPDPGSRSREKNGARLRLIDPDRAWGWVVVNKEKYREKARLMSRDAQRTESGVDAERKRKERVPRSPPKSPALPLSESESESETKTNTKTDQIKTYVEPRRSTGVDAIFDHWRQVWNHPKSQLDGKRRKAILAALKLGYTADDLCESITGYLQSPHHRGENDRQTVYDSIDLLLRDASHIDAGLAFARGPPSQTSALARHNVSVLAAWQAPRDDDETGRPRQISGGDGEHGGSVRQGNLAATR